MVARTSVARIKNFAEIAAQPQEFLFLREYISCITLVSNDLRTIYFVFVAQINNQ